MKQLPIVKKKLKELNPSLHNPRTITKMARENLKKSIQKFGYAGIIVWNKKTDRILSGHQGVDIMKEMYGEDTEIEVREVDVSEAEEKTLTIRLNRHDGQWDEDKLIRSVMDIQKEDEDLLRLTGYDDKEIDIMLEQTKDQFEDNQEDRIMLSDIKGTKIKEGDLFEIDNKHKVLCGNPAKLEDMKKLIQLNKFDLMVTNTPREPKKQEEFNAWTDIMENVYKNSKELIKESRFICISTEEGKKFNLSARHSNLLERQEFSYFRTVHWIKPEEEDRVTITIPYPRWMKPKPVNGSVLIYCGAEEIERNPEITDTVLIYTDHEIPNKEKPNRKEEIPIEKNLLKKYASTIWRIPRNAENSYQHGNTWYSPDIAENCIRFYSMQNEIVFDPFLGSGEVLNVAENMKRKCYGMDINPKYIELTLRRYKQKHKGAIIKCLNREMNLEI